MSVIVVNDKLNSIQNDTKLMIKQRTFNQLFIDPIFIWKKNEKWPAVNISLNKLIVRRYHVILTIVLFQNFLKWDKQTAKEWPPNLKILIDLKGY